MPFHKITHRTLQYLSYFDVDVRKQYKLIRKLVNVTHINYAKPFHRTKNAIVAYEGLNVLVRIYPSKRQKPPGTIIYLHGGGWVSGSVDSYDRVCYRLSSHTGWNVVAADYPLAPEYPYPTALHVCHQVVRAHLDDNFFSLPRGKTVLMGDSAGGNLTAALTLLMRDRREPACNGQILLYPATNDDHGPDAPFASLHEENTGSLLTAKRVSDYMYLYTGENVKGRQDPYLAPLLAKSHADLPPALVLTASLDPLRDEGESYAEKLREAGCRVTLHRLENAFHGFITLPSYLPRVREAQRYIDRFLFEVAAE